MKISKRVALLGGSFDPIHNGHLGLISGILNSGSANEVWVVPSGARTDKKNEAPWQHRLAMCREAICTTFGEHGPVRVEDADATGRVPAEGTMALLDLLRAEHPETHFRFIIGTDLLASLPTWRQVERLKQEVEFVVITRPGIPLSSPPGFTIHPLTLTESAATDLSSTLIRNLLRHRKSVAGYIPEGVARWISTHGLYGSAPPRGDIVRFRGRWIALIDRNGWEMAERIGCSGIVGIVAKTADDKVLLVEQYRPAVNAKVIEIPAGLAGDGDNSRENLTQAAIRELVEETGHLAEQMTFLFRGPSSAGTTSEILDFFLATKLKKVSSGGGDESESITVHEISLSEIDSWLETRVQEGALVDPKVYTALHFIRRSG